MLNLNSTNHICFTVNSVSPQNTITLISSAILLYLSLLFFCQHESLEGQKYVYLCKTTLYHYILLLCSSAAMIITSGNEHSCCSITAGSLQTRCFSVCAYSLKVTIFTVWVGGGFKESDGAPSSVEMSQRSPCGAPCICVSLCVVLCNLGLCLCGCGFKGCACICASVCVHASGLHISLSQQQGNAVFF